MLADPDTEDGLPKRLASSKVLVRSVFWNFLGLTVPLLIAIPVIPVLVSKLGIERFGILTLVWVAIGYFSLLDLGLGRALTQIIARNLGGGAMKRIGSVAITGLMLMTVLSLAGAVTIWLIAPWLVHSTLRLSTSLQDETLSSFYLIAISVPFIVTSSGFIGVLAAYQRFDIINWIRTPGAVLTILLPVVVVEFTVRLEWITAIIVFARVIAWLAYLVTCSRLVSWAGHAGALQEGAIKELFRLGGWMTFTNALSPFLVYLDRFVIAGMVSVAAVAYYSTPYEVITKLWLVPGAIVGALFPAFATTLVSDRARASFLLAQGTKYVFLTLFPLLLGIVIFASELLDLWLGQEFAMHSSWVLQVLAVGVLINSLVHPGTVLIQAAGRPDMIGKLHLVELLFYVPALWYLTTWFGIEGAAVAWTLRVSVDAAFLHTIALSLLPRQDRAFSRLMFQIAATGMALVGAFSIVDPMAKIFFFVAVVASFYLLAWHQLLLDSERALIRAKLMSMRLSKN